MSLVLPLILAAVASAAPAPQASARVEARIIEGRVVDFGRARVVRVSRTDGPARRPVPERRLIEFE